MIRTAPRPATVTLSHETVAALFVSGEMVYAAWKDDPKVGPRLRQALEESRAALEAQAS